MAEDTTLSGAELQQSQITGAGKGEFTRDQMQGEKGGSQLGGGPDPSDMGSPGGSSGGGGYGNAQNQANHQGQQTAPTGHDAQQSRGELFDEQQGGGRSDDSVSGESIAQAGGSDGSFDQATDTNELSAQADRILAGEDRQAEGQSGIDRADFERDADS
jgi:hypothetical protein